MTGEKRRHISICDRGHLAHCSLYLWPYWQQHVHHCSHTSIWSGSTRRGFILKTSQRPGNIWCSLLIYCHHFIWIPTTVKMVHKKHFPLHNANCLWTSAHIQSWLSVCDIGSYLWTLPCNHLSSQAFLLEKVPTASFRHHCHRLQHSKILWDGNAGNLLWSKYPIQIKEILITVWNQQLRRDFWGVSWHFECLWSVYRYKLHFFSYKHLHTDSNI